MDTRSERGAAAVVVAISLVALIGVGTLAIDLGSAWSVKRDYAAGTDAAALAAARSLYRTYCEPAAEDAASDRAREVMEQNVPTDVSAGASLDEVGVNFTMEYGEPCGRATARYVGPGTVTFAGIFGVDDLEVYAETTASPGDFVGGGLRPFAVCVDDPDISAWLAAGPPSTITLEIEKSWKPSDSEDEDPICGGAPGNWGFVCYEEDFGGCNASGGSGLKLLIREGYNEDVDLGSSSRDDGDCDLRSSETPGDGDDCDVKTGNFSQVTAALEDVVCPAETTPDANDCKYRFPILGMDDYTKKGGSTAELDPERFIAVVLRDFNVGGADLQFLEFELINLFDEGRASEADSGLLERDPPVICDVEDNYSDFDSCN